MDKETIEEAIEETVESCKNVALMMEGALESISADKELKEKLVEVMGEIEDVTNGGQHKMTTEKLDENIKTMGNLINDCKMQ